MDATAATIRSRLAHLRAIDPAAAQEIDETWTVTLAILDAPADKTVPDLPGKPTVARLRRQLLAELTDRIGNALAENDWPAA